MGCAEHGWAGPAPPAGEAVLHMALNLLELAGRPAGGCSSNAHDEGMWQHVAY